MLEPEACAALLRRRRVASLCLATAGILHIVALVENDDAVEIAAEPVDDLLHARGFVFTLA